MATLRRSAVAVTVLGALAVIVGLGATTAPVADAQILGTTTTTAPPSTTEPAPETTIPTTTEPPTTTTEATTTAPPQTAPPTTRARTTTTAATTAPATTATTAPPSAPPTAPTTTALVEERATVTQETPDLSGLLTVWVLAILAAVGIMATAWWRSRHP